MLTALGVIEGYQDGSFRPDDTVTRAEMAKMIYVIRTGKSDASAYNDDATTFTDITNHWARGYIKYCNSLGIIAGHSATRFAPDDTVTTQEAAKMLLVTLGYDAERAGLVGAGWGAKTTALADENGLMKDVNNGTTQGLPRQYAAQLMYNAIFANTVTLRDGEYTKYGYDNSLNPTIGEKYMDLYKVSAGVLYKCNLVDGKDYYSITTSGYTDADKKVVTTFNKVPTDVSDLIGQEVVVLRKVNASDETVYGVYADDDSKVVATGYASQLEADGDKIKLDGTSYKTDIAHTTASVYNINVDSTATVAMDSLFTAAENSTVTPNTAATQIELIDNNGDGKVDLSVQTPAKVAKVTAVSTTSITVNYLTAGDANATIKFEDADIYDGVAKNDYVTVIDDANRSNDKDLVTKLDVVSAEAEATRTGEVRVDGTWYKTAVNEGTLLAPVVGNTYDFVIIGGVVVVADETAASSSNIAYISGIEKANDGDDTTNNSDPNKLTSSIGSNDGTLKARMFFQDGSDKEITVSKINGKKINSTAADGDAYNSAKEYAAADDLDALAMYTYSELSDGTYDVKKVDGSNDVGMDWQTSLTADSDRGNTTNSLYYKQKIAKVSIADDAVIFVQVAGETKTMTGKQIKNWADTVSPAFTTGSQMLTKSTNGIAYVKFATLVNTTDGSKVPGASNDKIYGYLISDPSTDWVNGEKKAAYEVWTGTETTTVYYDASADTTGAKAGDVISYSDNGDFIDAVAIAGHVGTTKAASKNVAYITGLNNGVINLYDLSGTFQTYDLADDCVFLAVNADKTAAMPEANASADTVSMANEVVYNGKTYLIPNAFVILNDDGDVAAIVYDADNSELNVSYSSTNTSMLHEINP